MYRIIKDGATVGITGALNYIKLLDNGCYGLCSEAEAQGVAFGGVPYQLESKIEMGGLDVVTVVEENDVDISGDHLTAAQVFVEQAEAGNVSETMALEHRGLFEAWQVGAVCPAGALRNFEGALYKCRQEHTSQEDWSPAATPALWAIIEMTRAGTIDDPIPAERGMEYTYGLYYLDGEDGKVYLCQRGDEAGSIVLQYLPHELTGNYFALVE